jgi:hypothetical protein
MSITYTVPPAESPVPVTTVPVAVADDPYTAPTIQVWRSERQAALPSATSPRAAATVLPGSPPCEPPPARVTPFTAPTLQGLTRVGFCAQGDLSGVLAHGSPLSPWAEPRYQGALCRHGLLGARASRRPASAQKRPGWLRFQVVPKHPPVSLLPLVTKNLPL